MGVPVHINRPPHSVTLHAWGRAATGWWGCVTWAQRVRTAEGDSEVPFAAWVPAATLTTAGGWAPPTTDLPRIRLPDDSRRWPAPQGWPSWYAGVWLDGDPASPPGVQLVTGAAWRNKPPMGVPD